MCPGRASFNQKRRSRNFEGNAKVQREAARQIRRESSQPTDVVIAPPPSHQPVAEPDTEPRIDPRLNRRPGRGNAHRRSARPTHLTTPGCHCSSLRIHVSWEPSLCLQEEAKHYLGLTKRSAVELCPGQLLLCHAKPAVSTHEPTSPPEKKNLAPQALVNRCSTAEVQDRPACIHDHTKVNKYSYPAEPLVF